MVFHGEALSRVPLSPMTAPPSQNMGSNLGPPSHFGDLGCSLSDSVRPSQFPQGHEGGGGGGHRLLFSQDPWGPDIQGLGHHRAWRLTRRSQRCAPFSARAVWLSHSRLPRSKYMVETATTETLHQAASSVAVCHTAQGGNSAEERSGSRLPRSKSSSTTSLASHSISACLGFLICKTGLKITPA